MTVFLKPRPQGAAIRSTDKSAAALWECKNRLPLTCTHHGDEISVACGRWRSCPGCQRRLQWRLRQRFAISLSKVPSGRKAMFFTLTFPLSAAPTEDQAHAALRSLVRRLRYRDYLDGYGWVLHRQRNKNLHYHGIAHMSWFDDDLAEWRRLIQASGFGVQNKLVVAKPSHAGYCASYISTRLAELAPLRRAYSFSRDFPRTDWEEQKRRTDALLAELGADPLCVWEPSGRMNWLLRA